MELQNVVAAIRVITIATIITVIVIVSMLCLNELAIRTALSSLMTTGEYTTVLSQRTYTCSDLERKRNGSESQPQ